MTQHLVELVAEFCQKHSLIDPQDSIVVGVSGGPDSTCLLHIFKTLAPVFRLNLTVAHLNHQLRQGSDDDERFVRHMAARWDIPIFVESHHIAQIAKERQEAIEETARYIRYQFLGRIARKVAANKIAVGHNADDQTETVLMHFLRGAGLAGLRGMLPSIDMSTLQLEQDKAATSSTLPPPQLIRPLLATPRSEIEAYCHSHDLQPRQDPSNQDITFFRNRLRHELLPYLETYNPNIRQSLQRMANVIAAETEFLNEHVDRAWPSVVLRAAPGRIDFHLRRWLELPLAMKRAVLRRAIHTLGRGLADISFDHIENALTLLEKGGAGKQATLPHGLLLTISYKTFTIAAENPAEVDDLDRPYLISKTALPLNLPGVTPLPQSNWQLRAELYTRSGLEPEQMTQVGEWEVYLDAGVVGQQALLRPRQAGDLFFPLGMGGHRQKVSDFMINTKIPASWRDHVPLLVSQQNQILWLCGYRLDERAAVQPKSQHILHLKFEREG